MRQANSHPRLPHFCLEGLFLNRAALRKQIMRGSVRPALLLLLGTFLPVSPGLAQQAKPAPPANGSTMTPAQAITLAEQGRCKEAIPALRRALTPQTPAAETRKRAGVLGLRCSLTLDSRDSAAEFIR